MNRSGLYAVVFSVLIALCTNGFAQSTHDARDVEGVLRYLVVAEKSAPLQLVTEDGAHDGVVSKVVERMAQRSGFQLVRSVMPVRRLEFTVAHHQVHNWISYDAPVWNGLGEAGFQLPVPLLSVEHAMLTCGWMGDPPRSVEDLRGTILVILSGFDYPELERAESEGLIRLLPVDRYEAGIEMVKRGRADGFVEMRGRLAFHVDKLKETADCLAYVNLNPIIPAFPIYLAVDRDMKNSWIERLVTTLKFMRDEGELRSLARRYGFAPAERPQ